MSFPRPSRSEREERLRMWKLYKALYAAKPWWISKAEGIAGKRIWPDCITQDTKLGRLTLLTSEEIARNQRTSL